MRKAVTLLEYFLPVMLAAWLVLPSSALAVGTSAGLDITNTATVTYTIGSNSGRVTSNAATIRVNEIIDAMVSWQDAGNRLVTSPDSTRVLTFLLSNTGNGNDSYALSVDNARGGDQFNPLLVDIYLDADGNGLFDPAIDTLYSAGTNDPLLAADASLNIFVRNNISANLNGGDIGNSVLVATSNTGSGAPGTSFAGAGDNGTSVIVGVSSGSSRASGSYEVSGAVVSLLKSVTIIDPLGGSQPVTGARMTYRIEVSVTGTASATGVVIADPIPANTTYTPASLTLNGATLSDAIDGDAGDVGGSSANTVTVKLGDLVPGSPAQLITFDVIIN